MLMIVPLMIWSDLTLIESHAWTAATIMPLTMAAATEMRRTIVKPPIAVGSPPMLGPSRTPTYQPTNAAVSIVPSMPMLTTPDRSHMTPQSAANAIGVAERMMLGAKVWTTSSSQRASSKTMPTTGRSVRMLRSTASGAARGHAAAAVRPGDRRLAGRHRGVELADAPPSAEEVRRRDQEEEDDRLEHVDQLGGDPPPHLHQRRPPLHGPEQQGGDDDPEGV